MTPSLFYLACVAGAVGLFLLMRPQRQAIRILGALIGAAAIAFLMVMILKALPDDSAVPYLEIVFGLGAIFGAGRVLTHPRPVFAAIYFVLVVVCSAGLFLMLRAEFMAFALIIVYAGAILITYLFVLMLAQEASAEPGETTYDHIPREPLAAVVVGFVMLASIGDALLSEEGGVNAPSGEAFLEAKYNDRWNILKQMPRLAAEEIEAVETKTGSTAVDGTIHIESGHAYVEVKNADGVTSRQELTYDQLPTNTQEVGWQLVAGFPVSLEMAGVILLMAMFGAIVLARRQIELGEDERRQAAGLEPILEDEDSEAPGGAT
jgi:NADH-quinone oxidoreductase subunit J